MKKTASNEPIVLSGRVYLDGFVAQEVDRFHLPAQLRRGDIKLHNVNRSGSRPRFGQTISFGGFLAAGIWDGKRWRKLLLRKKAAVEATHTGVVEMRSVAVACVGTLTRLVGWTAVWFTKDSGYEVAYDAFPGKTVAPGTVVDTVEKPAVRANGEPGSPAAAAGGVEKPAEESAKTAAPSTAVGAGEKQGPTFHVEPSGQLALFDDMPVGGKLPRKRSAKPRRKTSAARRHK